MSTRARKFRFKIENLPRNLLMSMTRDCPYPKYELIKNTTRTTNWKNLKEKRKKERKEKKREGKNEKKRKETEEKERNKSEI